MTQPPQTQGDQIPKFQSDDVPSSVDLTPAPCVHPHPPRDEPSCWCEYKHFIAAVLGCGGSRAAGVCASDRVIPKMQRGVEGAVTGLSPPSCHQLCHRAPRCGRAGGGSSALLLQPLHPQDLAQEPLHVLIHVALGWRGHWWGHRRQQGDSAWPERLWVGTWIQPLAASHRHVAGWCRTPVSPVPPQPCPHLTCTA